MEGDLLDNKDTGDKAQGHEDSCDDEEDDGDGENLGPLVLHDEVGATRAKREDEGGQEGRAMIGSKHDLGDDI